MLNVANMPSIPNMDQVFTTTSLYALLGVSAIAGIAKLASDTLLPKNASKTDRWTFVWLVSWYGSSFMLMLD